MSHHESLNVILFVDPRNREGEKVAPLHAAHNGQLRSRAMPRRNTMKLLPILLCPVFGPTTSTLEHDQLRKNEVSDR